MKKLEIPYFKDIQEEIAFVCKNKSQLIVQKKSIYKQADGFAFVQMPNLKNYGVMKSNAAGSDVNTLQVKAIINTTYLLDSHEDVHIDGLWNKSLKENKNLMHLQEHESHKFKAIISDGNDLNAFTKMYTWKELGFDFKGQTEALEFDSMVKRERNTYMFGQYNKGYVKNHSVGMHYVKIRLAVGDESIASEKEFETYTKHIDKIANREAVERKKYFWAILEAKAIEGSAVPLGSNFVTPTMSVEAAEKHFKTEAEKSLQDKKNYLFI